MDPNQFPLGLSIEIAAYPKVITGTRLLSLWYGYREWCQEFLRYE